QNRNGTQVSYLQLVHNEWDPAARTSRTKILYSFGRTDQVDTAAIERLIVSLGPLARPAAAPLGTAPAARPGRSATGHRRVGPELHLLAPVGWHRRARRAVAPAGHRHGDEQAA